MYQANLPANTIIYLDEYRKMIMLEMLNADSLLRYYDKDLTIPKLIENDRLRKGFEHLVFTKNMENSGMPSGSLLVNLIPIILLI